MAQLWHSSRSKILQLWCLIGGHEHLKGAGQGARDEAEDQEGRQEGAAEKEEGQGRNPPVPQALLQGNSQSGHVSQSWALSVFFNFFNNKKWLFWHQSNLKSPLPVKLTKL